MADIADIGFRVDTAPLIKGDRALDDLGQTSARTSKSIDMLEGEMQQLNAASSRMGRGAVSANGSVSKLSGGMRGMGGSVQNASFQLQDIIVQLQMGTDVSRVMAQQLPQLAGGFGAVGAAIGVVVGAGFALAPILFELASGGEEAAHSLGDVDDAMDDLKDKTRDASLEIERLNRGLRDTSQVVLQDRLREIANETSNLQKELENLQPQGRAGADFFSAKTQELRSSIQELAEERQRINDQLAEFETQASQLETIENRIDDTESRREAANENIQMRRDLQTEIVNEIEQLQALEEAYVVAGQSLEDANRAKEYQAILQKNGISLYSEEARQIYDLLQARNDLEDSIDAETEKRKEAEAARKKAEKDRADEIKKRNRELDKERQKNADKEKRRQEDLNDYIAGTFDTTFFNIITGTQSVSEAFSNMATNIANDILRLVIRQSISAPIAEAISSGIAGSFGTTQTTSYHPGMGTGTYANGGAFIGGREVTAFANGGVVSSPTLFPMANGAGLMGEAGPEAIMPLTRGPDGRLGVSGGGGASIVNVNIINENGGQVETSQRGNELDILIKAVSNDITGGGKTFNAIRKTFELSPALARRG